MNRESHRTSARSQVVLLTGLVVLWCLVWGQFTVLSVVSGAVLAIVVSLLFYLPAIDLSGRVNLWYVVVFFGRLVVYSAVVNVVRWEEEHGTVVIDIRVPNLPGDQNDDDALVHKQKPRVAV